MRRKQSEVLTELPPKRRQFICAPSAPRPGRAGLKREAEVLAATEAEVAAARAPVELLTEDQACEAYEEAVYRLHQAERHQFSEIARARHETALAKVPDVVEHIYECLEAEPKLVVFFHYRDVIDQVMAGLDARSQIALRSAARPARTASRSATRRTFQTDAAVRVLGRRASTRSERATTYRPAATSVSGSWIGFPASSARPKIAAKGWPV